MMGFFLLLLFPFPYLSSNLFSLIAKYSFI
jgi:hypothetical protein